MVTYKVIAGLDIGNGYVKGALVSDDGYTEVDIPSGVTLMTRGVAVPARDADAKEELDDVFNNLDVSFTTPMIPDGYRRLFGNRGLSAGNGSFEEFDVVGNRSKAQQPLSKILVLGSIAGKVLRDYVFKNNTLPNATDVLSIEVVCALALPITEYMMHRTSYAQEFTNNVHTVTVHNFETPVTCKIAFKSVQVIAEGASAQYAINARGIKLIEHMMKDVSRFGIDFQGITAQDFLNARNTIGVDIGEGTVNFPVFTNGKFNTDASITLNSGYGTVLNNALRAMQEQNFSGGFTSRKQLGAYLQEGVNPLKRAHYNRVKQYVDEEIVFFARSVAEKFGQLLYHVGASTDVVYVYGGGSGPVREILHEQLVLKVREVMGSDTPIVMYLDSEYSRNLNREGLRIAAEAINAALSKK